MMRSIRALLVVGVSGTVLLATSKGHADSARGDTDWGLAASARNTTDAPPQIDHSNQSEPARPEPAADRHEARPQPPPDKTVYDIDIGDSPVLGPDDARVTIVAFVSYQRPHCVREWTKLKMLMAEYPDDVRLAIKHFPLSIHKKARPVHATCALAREERGMEGYWRMHDMILAAPNKLEVADMRGYAEKLGLI